MKGKYCERFDALYNELEKIYPGYHVFGARYMREDNYFPYYFNIKNNEADWVPFTIIVYEPTRAEAFIATSSDGVLEKQIVKYFDSKGVKSKLQMGFKKDSIEILKAPFEGVKRI